MGTVRAQIYEEFRQFVWNCLHKKASHCAVFAFFVFKWGEYKTGLEISRIFDPLFTDPDFFTDKCKIFITSERELPDNLKKYLIKVHPADLHSVLHYSSLCISDGSTTAVEAALLGTPTLHYEKYVTKEGIIGAKELLGYLNELSDNYNLFDTYSSENKFIDMVKEYYNNTKYKKEFLKNSEQVFIDKDDVTKVILKMLDNYQPHK